MAYSLRSAIEAIDTMAIGNHDVPRTANADKPSYVTFPTASYICHLHILGWCGRKKHDTWAYDAPNFIVLKSYYSARNAAIFAQSIECCHIRLGAASHTIDAKHVRNFAKASSHIPHFRTQ